MLRPGTLKRKRSPHDDQNVIASTSKTNDAGKSLPSNSPANIQITNARTVSDDEDDIPKFSLKLDYIESVISSKCALRRLKEIQTYAIRRGELKLFGLIADSINELERIITKSQMTTKQPQLTEFFNDTDSVDSQSS